MTREQRLVAQKKQSEKKNFMRTNLNATKYADVSPSRDSPLKQHSKAGKSMTHLGGSPGSNRGKSTNQGDSPTRHSKIGRAHV